MAREARGTNRWRAPILACTLVIAIGYFVSDLFPRVVTEFRLRKAEEHVHENPGRALVALEKDGRSDDLSARQKDRGVRIARTALDLVTGERSILRRVGWREFDPSAPRQEYVTASTEMTLVFEIPANLKAFGPVIRVSSAGQDLCAVEISADGTSALGAVPLQIGESLEADVDLTCPIGTYGVVNEPIARGIRLVQSSRGPTVRLRAGDSMSELREGVVTPMRVSRGTPLTVQVSDERGLAELQWSVDAMAHEPLPWAASGGASTREAHLPADLTAEPSNMRTIEFRASNSNRSMTRVSVALFVNDPGVPFIASASLEGLPLADGAIVDVSDKVLKLALSAATGEDLSGLVVLWDERPLRIQVQGQDVAATLDSDMEGTRSLVVQAGGVPVLRARIRFDWTPPVVTAVLDPGNFARELEVFRSIHEVPVGSIVITTIVDGTELDRGSIAWVTEGAALEVLDEPLSESRDADAIRMWTRRIRCSETGEGRLRVSGSDRAGNRTTIHEFRIRVADPMTDRAVTVNGKAFPGTKPIACSDPRIVVTSEGGIDLDGLAFFVLDPAEKNHVIAQVALGRTERTKARTGTLDLSRVTTSGKTVTGVLSRNEQELSKGLIVVDFEKPVFRVQRLDSADGADGTIRYFAEPGQLVSVSLTDDVAVDASTITAKGAMVESTNGASEISIVLVLAEVFEEPIVLRAADEAGNVAELRFEVVSRVASPSRDGVPVAPVSRPADTSTPKAPPDGGPLPPEHPAPFAELRGTTKITHPQLGVYMLVAPADGAHVAPFYLAEHELLVKDWRTFVGQMPGASRNDTLTKEASSLLNYNTERLQKEEDEPVSGMTSDLVKAYVRWANEIARDYGVWRVPTVAQWQLAAGRATNPQAVYPTTASHPSGNDLTNLGIGGALFGRAFLTAREMPKQALQPGAFGLRGMPGSLYEWVIDGAGAQARLRLIGGSAFAPKEACRLDALPKLAESVEPYERGLRLALLPRAR